MADLKPLEKLMSQEESLPILTLLLPVKYNSLGSASPCNTTRRCGVLAWPLMAENFLLYFLLIKMVPSFVSKG
jgi:hypothetical protein